MDAGDLGDTGQCYSLGASNCMTPVMSGGIGSTLHGVRHDQVLCVKIGENNWLEAS